MTKRLRNWSQASYSASDGRSASSLADENQRDGTGPGTHAENVSAQLPKKDPRDRRNTQDRTPVHKRPLG